MTSQDCFHYRDGELQCEAVPAARIAAEFGTPTYVYSASALRSRYHAIRDAFGRWDPLVCFSVKSCSNLSVLRLLAEEGSGFDVVSGGELYRVLRAGADAGRVVFAGVGKTADEIEYAVREGVYMFDVESRGELEQIDGVARRLGTETRVAIRVNPDVDAQTHRKTTTGKGETKFGIGINETEELVREAADWSGVAVRGLHVHLGSPIHSTEPYEQALQKLTALMGRLRGAGFELDHLNLGGGYCISYTGEEVIGPADYAAALKSYLEKLRCVVIIEPGRYIAGNSGLLLSRVLYRKENEYGKRFVVCDAAMNDLMRPTLYGAFHRIWPVSGTAGMPDVMEPDRDGYEGFETEIVDIVGGVCETGDFLAQDRPLPPVQPGDLLAVFGAGAYAFTMSSNYNSRPRAAEVLVQGRDCRLVRRRERYADLVELEEGYL
ncbi:MAG: diaminopimelate decarboxylase [Candidatus Brocadiaceae bacterium]